MGEVVHGDYRRWVNPETLDSVTNYEGYKGLYSSLAETELFRDRLCAQPPVRPGGLYPVCRCITLPITTMSTGWQAGWANPAHLYPLYLLLFTHAGRAFHLLRQRMGLASEAHASRGQALRLAWSWASCSAAQPSRTCQRTSPAWPPYARACLPYAAGITPSCMLLLNNWPLPVPPLSRQWSSLSILR